MATSAQFVSIPRNGGCKIGYISSDVTTHIYNALRDGTNSLRTVNGQPATEAQSFGLLYTAGANGARIDSISIKGAGPIGVATSTNVLRFYEQVGGVGSKRLIYEIALNTNTPSATGLGVTSDPTSLGWILEANSKIWVTQHTCANSGDVFDCIVKFGGDF